MEKNKTGKYLKYAIGEIVLVVLGILIALQINNWNQNRILAKEELQIMKGLLKEFNKNKIRFDKAYEFHKNRKESIETIVSINANHLSMDSLISLVIRVNRSYTFNPHQGIYNSIINSGKIELISNASLKERIAGFQDLIIDFQEDEKYIFDFTSENIHKFQLNERLHDNYQVRRGLVQASEDEKQRIKDKYVKFIESDIFESQLSLLSGYMNQIFKEGPALREELDSIIKLIEIEIEAH
jgi:translation initiation factor 2B subunit (eIF-2B alpha/beta/delta family)